MPTFKLEELKYTELASFSRERTLFTLVVSPLEEHGPHLPLGVDPMNARFFADKLTERFLQEHPHWNVVQMPALMIGSFIFDAPGSVRVRPKVIRALVIDQLSSLAKFGFRHFLISNAHGGPTHIVALEEATRYVSRRYGVRAVSFSGHLIWQFLLGKYWPQIVERLSLTAQEEEALMEDAHAGQWETSMMLKLRPDLVDPGYKDLKPFTAPLIRKIQPNYPLQHGNRGYVGHPALANEELAEVSSSFLIEKAYAIVEAELLSPEPSPPSAFYRIPFFRTNFLPTVAILALAAGLLYWLRED